MKGLDVYKDHAVSTQGKGRLIVMLYEGAIKFMNLAIEQMQAGNLDEKSRYISRAQDIINELNAVLDMDEGGQVATNLRQLYSFMTRRLSEANTKQDTQMVRDVISLMQELHQGWKAITC